MQPMTLSQSATLLQNGAVGVIATDTIYGIVAKALNQQAVERVYAVKKRTPTKPCIILISSLDDIELFNITLSGCMRQTLSSYWPGPVSVIVDCDDQSLAYLHRDTQSLAFRLPAKKELQELIVSTGPLIAPSANPEGLDPAKNIDEAIAYFGTSVDFYVEGQVSEKPSKIIKLTASGVEIIRD